MRPCSKTDEPARSPAEVRWKGLAVNSAARGERREGVWGTSGSIARGDGWAVVNCGGDWPWRRGNWRSPRGPWRRLKRLLKPAGRVGDGVDTVAVGRTGESVIAVSLIAGLVGDWMRKFSVTNSKNLGGEIRADSSLLSEVLSESLASCCSSCFIPATGTPSFSPNDLSNDGSDIVISGPKFIFGRDMSVGLRSLLARSLATSCRSLATPPTGAGASFSSMPSRSIVEGESTISVSESEMFGGDAEVGRG